MNDPQSLSAAIVEAVTLHDHDPSWAEAFALERARLLAGLAGVFIDVQHIGSTAVPGLSAKPIVDLLAGVASMRLARSLSARICAMGYTTSTAFNESLANRQWFMRWAQGRRTHHLHLVAHDSLVWHEHLRFRDALRSSPPLRARYATLKHELAAQHASDREAYTNAKAEFIRGALRDAG